MVARVVNFRPPSQRRKKRAGKGRERSDLGKMRKILRHCLACGGQKRVATACDDEKLSPEGKVLHDAIVEEGLDHVHMTCPDCGHETFVSFEEP